MTQHDENGPHILVRLPRDPRGPTIDAITDYFVVADMSVTSAPAPSGVLLAQLEEPGTPAWLRELFRDRPGGTRP
jgi:hypothetical protein